MTAMPELKLEPLLTYPREAEIGKTYLFTVDLRSSGGWDLWPYPRTEEVTIYFFVDAGECFRTEPLGEPAVVLHRFGGTYGPARFLLTAGAKETVGNIRVTLANGAGMPLGVVESPDISVRAQVESRPVAMPVVRTRRASVARPVTEVPADQAESADSMISRARSLAARGELEEAEKLFDLAIGLSNDRRAWQGLALIARTGNSSDRIGRRFLAYLRSSPDQYKRREAARAIGSLGVASDLFVDELVAALQDRSVGVRAEAAQSLSKLGNRDSKVVQALISRLQDEKSQVRARAAVALGDLGDRTAIPALQLLAHDAHKQVVQSAADAVRKLESSRAPATGPKKVVLSYSFRDRGAVKQIYRRLFSEGFDPWMDTLNIAAGAGWQEETNAAIRSASVVLLFLSGSSPSETLERETMIALERWQRARTGNFSIFPVRLDDCEIPPRLSEFKTIDLFRSDGWAMLTQAITAAVDARAGTPSESDSGYEEEEIAPGNVPDDPWKGQFGGQSVGNWRQLSAKVTKRDAQYYQIELTVISTDPSAQPLRGEVKFYLHPDFAKSQPTVKVGKGGKATVRRLTVKPFTAGALVDGGRTRLELDLSELTDAPAGFREAHEVFSAAATGQSTGYRYACYFSYPAGPKLVEDFVGRFYRALADELELLTEKPIFFDRHELRGAKDVEQQMAGAMAQSACYLVFFTPTTFRTSFTRRELEAMRILQQRRGQFLGVGRLGLGLILPMVLRRDDQMPEFLKRIQWFDFEGAMSGGPNWFRSRRARQQIREVAEAVYARCREADAIPQAFADWQSFVLPPEIDLRADASPGFSSATVPISEDPADLLRQGSEHLNHGEYEEARRKMERAIAIYESRSDMRGLTLALNDLGESYYITRDFPEAEQHYQRALAITGDTGDLNHTAIILDNLGLVQAEQGQSDEAKASYRKSLDLFEGLDDKAGMAAVLGNLGWVLLNRNDFFEAIDSFNQQLTLARETGSVQREGIALSNLGHAYARSGELTRAVEFHRQAIQVFESIGDRGNLADALYSLTQTLYAFGQPAQAIPHGERAAEIYDQLGATRRAGEVRQLLANLRRQQGGDGDASIRKLAQEYDDVHRGMTGSSARTRRVNEIVEQMRDWVPSVRSLIDVYSRSSSPGLRVAGVVILQEAPDQNYLGWLSERVKRETPFVGHQAALALLNAVRRLDDEYYDRLGEAIANAKASLDAKNLSRDADRYVTLEQADRELQTRRTTSAYYDPESIKEIGRRLQTGTYPELTEQLKEGEIIVGLFRAPNQVLLATHITNEARLTQMESRNAPEGFFALRFVQGSEGESPYVLAERPRAPRPARKKKAARAAPRKAAKPKKKAAAKRPTRKK